MVQLLNVSFSSYETDKIEDIEKRLEKLEEQKVKQMTAYRPFTNGWIA